MKIWTKKSVLSDDLYKKSIKSDSKSKDVTPTIYEVQNVRKLEVKPEAFQSSSIRFNTANNSVIIDTSPIRNQQTKIECRPNNSNVLNFNDNLEHETLSMLKEKIIACDSENKKHYIKINRNNIIVNMVFSTILHFSISNGKMYALLYAIFILVLFSLRYHDTKFTMEESDYLYYLTYIWNASFIILIIIGSQKTLVGSFLLQILYTMVPSFAVVLALMIYKVFVYCLKCYDYISISVVSRHYMLVLSILVVFFTGGCLLFEFFSVSYFLALTIYSSLFLLLAINNFFILCVTFKGRNFSVFYFFETILASISMIMTYFMAYYSFINTIYSKVPINN